MTDQELLRLAALAAGLNSGGRMNGRVAGALCVG